MGFNMILLDSSAVIDLFLGTPRGKKVREKMGTEPFGVTSITVHEVLVGAKDKDVICAFFKSISVIPFDADASYKSVEIETSLRKKGLVLAKLDLFIASICIEHNLLFVTTDADFKRVDGLRAIHIS